MTRSVARLIVVLALVAGSAAATALAWAAGGVAGPSPPSGRDLYLRDCAVCHGARGEGTNRGPGLATRGAADVDLWVGTGLMPIGSPGTGLQRTRPAYTRDEVRAIVEYARSFITAGPDVPTVDLTNADVARGGELFRLNCAGCHGTAGVGGAMIYSPVDAPPLARSTPTQVAEAMLVGPDPMPVLSPVPLDAEQTRDIAAYVRELQHPRDRGGWNLGHLGPVPEGAAAWLLGLAPLVLATWWITRRPGETP